VLFSKKICVIELLKIVENIYLL